MSATTTRIALAKAREIAWELMAELTPYCQRIEVAGSIRRGVTEVGDIELVAIPTRIDFVQPDLFGTDPKAGALDRLVEHTNRLLEDRQIQPLAKPRWGERHRSFLYRGVQVDLFSVIPPAQWGVILLLRTGPNDFGHRLVTPIERRGWSADGRPLGHGWMPTAMFMRSGALWRNNELVPTPEEVDVFKALHRGYIRPEDRR